MAEEARSRLGRGLASLIGDVGEAPKPDRPRQQRRVPIEFLHPNPRNPRRHFAEDDIAELSASIKERGVIQPIVVRSSPGKSNSYEIIAGERRWRAAQRAGLHEVPIVALDVGDSEALEIAIIENVQRTDLNALEEARGYQALAQDFQHSQDHIAKIVGKSRSHVANTLRLLKLPDAVKAMIESGDLSAGHARALLGLDDPEAAARRIVAEGLNVRQTEQFASGEEAAGAKKTGKTGKARGDADTLALAKRISDALGLQVDIAHRANGAGAVRVRYRTLEQLEDIIRRLERTPKG